MVWRILTLTFLLVFFAVFPLHGASPGANPCYLLTKGLQRLEAENITYRGYYFSPAGALQPDQPAQRKEPLSRAGQTDARWSVTGGLEAGYTVFQVKGSDFGQCSDLMDQLTAASKEDNPGAGLAWLVEAFLPGEAGDIPRLGGELVDILGGTLRSSDAYNGSYHMLADIPWDSGRLLLGEGPVNLNLELSADPLNNGIRLRAGVPVLLSPSHFPD